MIKERCPRCGEPVLFGFCKTSECGKKYVIYRGGDTCPEHWCSRTYLSNGEIEEFSRQSKTCPHCKEKILD